MTVSSSSSIFTIKSSIFSMAFLKSSKSSLSYFDDILYYMEKQVKLLKKDIVDINADCVKRCPHDGRVFAVGHYSQIEGENVIGALSALVVGGGKEAMGWEIRTVKTGPILHVVWVEAVREGEYVLVAACRDSCARIFGYNPQSKEFTLRKQIAVEGETYCPYIDAISEGNLITIVVSTSHQCVWHIVVDENFNVKSQKKLKNHEYTVWTCRINPFNLNVFCSGDELSRLNVYDMRKPNPLVLSNNKVHQEGVCDILFDIKQQNTFLTSCFGGGLRWFDIRKVNDCFRKYKTSGVLWRIVPDQKRSQLLICVSSQNFYEVIDISKPQQIKKIYDIKGHKSLAYAADWNDEVILTASFYDKLVCMWERQL